MLKEKVSAISDGYNDWLRALDFYKQELNILKERLTEIAGKNTGKETGADIEHYENQIAVQLENVDTLRHDIDEAVVKVAHQAKENTAGYVDTVLVDKVNGQKATFETTEKIINELRHNFNRFAANRM